MRGGDALTAGGAVADARSGVPGRAAVQCRAAPRASGRKGASRGERFGRRPFKKAVDHARFRPIPARSTEPLAPSGIRRLGGTPAASSFLLPSAMPRAKTSHSPARQSASSSSSMKTSRRRRNWRSTFARARASWVSQGKERIRLQIYRRQHAHRNGQASSSSAEAPGVCGLMGSQGDTRIQGCRNPLFLLLEPPVASGTAAPTIPVPRRPSLDCPSARRVARTPAIVRRGRRFKARARYTTFLTGARTIFRTAGRPSRGASPWGGE